MVFAASLSVLTFACDGPDNGTRAEAVAAIAAPLELRGRDAFILEYNSLLQSILDDLTLLGEAEQILMVGDGELPAGPTHYAPAMLRDLIDDRLNAVHERLAAAERRLQSTALLLKDAQELTDSRERTLAGLRDQLGRRRARLEQLREQVTALRAAGAVLTMQRDGLAAALGECEFRLLWPSEWARQQQARLEALETYGPRLLLGTERTLEVLADRGLVTQSRREGHEILSAAAGARCPGDIHYFFTTLDPQEARYNLGASLREPQVRSIQVLTPLAYAIVRENGEWVLEVHDRACFWGTSPYVIVQRFPR